MKATIIIGKCEIKLCDLAETSVDSIVTDPPYELGFMGKVWDSSGMTHNVEMWRECLRVLKPGGFLLSFGGSRTYHRMACAIEDAGFEIRDQIMWIYGSGFPKSLDVSKAIDKAERGVPQGAADPTSVNHGKYKGGCSEDNIAGRGFGAGPGQFMRETGEKQKLILSDTAKQWDGWGTALKPAHEPIVVARKPLIGTVAANVLKYGTGAMDIDGCRVATNETLSFGSREIGDGVKYNPIAKDRQTTGEQSALGRWPANVIHDGSDEVLNEFARAGVSKSISGGITSRTGAGLEFGMGTAPRTGRDDSGSAARFFKNFPSGDIWLDQNLAILIADFADEVSVLPNELVCTALGHVANLVLPEGLQAKCVLHSQEPSMNVTRNELKQIAMSVTAMIQSLEIKSWLEPQPESVTQTSGHVTSVVPRNLTGTTQIMTNLMRLNGSVVSAISSITATSLVRGGQDCRSRVFYTAKADKEERESGLYDLVPKNKRANTHPTVKPIDLMCYLVRLVTQEGGVVLDPFTGSGSTGIAALKEGCNFIGIEENADYAGLAERRIKQALPLFADVVLQAENTDESEF